MQVPAETPVTIPEEEPTVATDVLLLSHVPPETASVKVVTVPVKMVVGPLIGASGSTVTVTVAILVPIAYVIIHVPAEMPVTMPVEDPTVAIAVLLLLHWPPAVESINVLLDPTHTLAVPVMA